jgi:hypothetical protein
MAPRAPSNPRQRARHEPLFDVHPRTGASIEVFYADRALETFGRSGAGWFWWLRRRGCAPDGSPTGPFATSYAAYRHAMNTATTLSLCDGRRALTDLQR